MSREEMMTINVVSRDLRYWFDDPRNTKLTLEDLRSAIDFAFESGANGRGHEIEREISLSRKESEITESDVAYWVYLGQWIRRVTGQS